MLLKGMGWVLEIVEEQVSMTTPSEYMDSMLTVSIELMKGGVRMSEISIENCPERAELLSEETVTRAMLTGDENI